MFSKLLCVSGRWELSLYLSKNEYKIGAACCTLHIKCSQINHLPFWCQQASPSHTSYQLPGHGRLLHGVFFVPLFRVLRVSTKPDCIVGDQSTEQAVKERVKNKIFYLGQKQTDPCALRVPRAEQGEWQQSREAAGRGKGKGTTQPRIPAACAPGQGPCSTFCQGQPTHVHPERPCMSRWDVPYAGLRHQGARVGCEWAAHWGSSWGWWADQNQGAPCSWETLQNPFASWMKRKQTFF